MKLPFPQKTTRRALSLALALVLAIAMLPFALADGAAQPPATTGDAAVVAPAAPEVSPAEETPSAVNVTTGDAVDVAPYTTTNSAVVVGTVLQITWNDDGSGGTSLYNNDMKTLLDSVSGLNDWNALTRVELLGDAEQLTGWNEWYLLQQYHWFSDTKPPPVLDLSGMTNLKTISGEQNVNGYDHLYVREVLFPVSLTSIGNFAFARCDLSNLHSLPPT